MISEAALTRLFETALDEQSLDEALDGLAKLTLELTRSRNTTIAKLDEDLGAIHLRHGAGREWSGKAKNTLFKSEANQTEGIVGYVVATGKQFLSGDVRKEPMYVNLFGTSISEVAVPIRDRAGRIRGVVNAESDESDHYGPEDVTTCRVVARLASVVIEREERERREEALVQVGSSLDRAKSEEELIGKVMSVAGDVLRFQAVSIFLLDSKRERFVLRGSLGELRDKVGQVSYAPGEGVTGWVCATGESVCLDRPQNDPRWRGQYLELPAEQIASFLAVPIVSRGKTIGVIRVLRRKTDNPYLDNAFTSDDERLLQAIAEQLAAGIENVRSIQAVIHVERMAAWGELSAKSSHMIGNRVFALKGDVNELGHLLKSDSTTKKELEELQESLGKNVTRIEEILQDFRDFVVATKISAEPADLNAIVRESVEEVFPKRSNIKLQYHLDESLPQVSVDVRRLRRAVSELVENSLSFFAEGTLRISTHRADARTIRVARLSKMKEYAVIEVQDQGPGVRDSEKALIFQPFYSSRVKGMGLGLSIVQGIIEAHGGAVVETGREGKGADFQMLLPLGERPA